MAHSAFFCGIFYGALILCSLVQIGKAWRSFTIQFDDVKCNIKSDALEFLNCSITQGGSHPLSFNLHGRLRSAVMLVRIDMFLTATRSGHPNFVLNLTDIDGCKFLGGKTDLNLLQIIHREVEKYTKLPDSCPINKDYEMHIQNLVLNPDNFPPYVPDTNFTGRTILRDGSTELLELWVHGSVTSKRQTKGCKKTGSSSKVFLSDLNIGCPNP